MPESCATHWTLSFPEPDIARLELDTPDSHVNLLGYAALAELRVLLDRLDSLPNLKGALFSSGKAGSFSVGADMDQMVRSIDQTRETVLGRLVLAQETLQRLASAHYISVAAVDGVCLGGGAELACWCDRRVFSTCGATQFGFPEIHLGLIPAWGGTARLPRLIGWEHAAGMIALDERIDSMQARSLGLADDLVSPDRLHQAAMDGIRQEVQSGRWRARRQRLAAPMAIDHRQMQAWTDTALESIRQRWHGRRPAAQRVLCLLRHSIEGDLGQACRAAAEALADLWGSPTHRALVNVHLLRRHNVQDSVVPHGTVAQAVQRVGIIGAGVMGIGIAAAHLQKGVPVDLADASAEALSRAMPAALDEAAASESSLGFAMAPPPNDLSPGTLIREPPERQAVDLPRWLQQADSLAALAACDLIVETVVETAEVKRRIYQQLETHVPPTTLLVSNTSTIPISSLSRSLQHPERFCGMHYFNPVRDMRLVEVVRGDLTSDQTVATVVQHALRIGKMPIVVHDSPGFLVNRLLSPYLNESLELLIAGATLMDIDRAAEAMGMPLGPLALIDLVGVDTSFFAGRTLWEAYPDRITPLPVLPALFRKGRLGRKSGAGFYRYEPGQQRGQPDSTVIDLLEPYVRRTRPISSAEITDRLFLPMLLEATRLLEQRIVRDVRDIDLGMIYGLGFPAERGGLLFWADFLGAARIVAMLEPYASLGSRFQPTQWLLDMARQDRRFSDNVPAEVRVEARGRA
jgi:3-hydroxyacyl-CoA dehydrogenase/enoyl-CoA hydratase/carnithine racemase